MSGSWLRWAGIMLGGWCVVSLFACVAFSVVVSQGKRQEKELLGAMRMQLQKHAWVDEAGDISGTDADGVDGVPSLRAAGSDDRMHHTTQGV